MSVSSSITIGEAVPSALPASASPSYVVAQSSSSPFRNAVDDPPGITAFTGLPEGVPPQASKMMSLSGRPSANS